MRGFGEYQGSRQRRQQTRVDGKAGELAVAANHSSGPKAGLRSMHAGRFGASALRRSSRRRVKSAAESNRRHQLPVARNLDNATGPASRRPTPRGAERADGVRAVARADLRAPCGTRSCVDQQPRRCHGTDGLGTGRWRHLSRAEPWRACRRRQALDACLLVGQRQRPRFELLSSPSGRPKLLSRGTVKVHLSHSYAKLDLRNRPS